MSEISLVFVNLVTFKMYTVSQNFCDTVYGWGQIVSPSKNMISDNRKESKCLINQGFYISAVALLANTYS